MFKRNALYGAILAATTINSAHAQIEEVIVTATKKAASTQDIPIAVTALGEESLAREPASTDCPGIVGEDTIDLSDRSRLRVLLLRAV